MKLLITGASGFIGSHFAWSAAGRGDAVRCLARPTSDLSPLRGLAAEIVAGDVADKDSLREAVSGVDAVVHCAATTSETSPDLTFSHRTNVLGTANLVELSAEHGVGRFVLVSTQSATERSTSAYGVTKLEAERIVASSGLAYTIVRPSTVYGPGARGLFAKIGRYVDKLPVVPIIGNGQQRFRPIYVADLVAALLACLDAERTVGRTYDLGGMDGVSFEQFIDGIGEVLGKKRLKLRIPIPVCVALARGLALAAKNPPLTIDNILGITQMSECDISRAQEDFDFRPITFREGIGLLRRDGVPTF
jgi:NADH dehydrogenase